MAREEGYPALSAIMADALRSGGMGFCLADSEGRVVRRDGALSQWTPTPGLSLFEHPLMEGIRDAVLNLRHTQGDMILPAIGLQDAAGTFKLDIRFAWMQSENCLLITCFQASMRAEMEAMAAQARREWQILQEQLRAKEDRLAAQSRLLATFIANVPAAIAMLDHELRYVSASDRWRSDFRLSSGTTEAGRACRESLAGTSLRWQQGLATCLEGTESTCELDSYTRPNGRHEWLRWRFLPFELPDAKRDATRASGVLLFCEIITDSVEQGRKLSEQARRLRSANVDMRNFSLALSHDLQSPVRQMVKFAQLLDEETSTELAGDGRDFLNEIHAAGARMQRMIEGLLRYLRVAARQPALGRADLGAAVAAALANLQHDIVDARAQTWVGTLPNVRGDQELLTILFQNLIQNSLKFAGSRVPELHISAQRVGSVWKITYSDNGPGIAITNVAKAFDLFQRLDDRVGISGTGVGLAICRWIADVHAGILEILPANGKGFELRLTLPTLDPMRPVNSTGPA